MHVLFEEDGQFKTAQILTETEANLQVETAGGRRIKIKAANVLLRYTDPIGHRLLDAAEQGSAEIDTDFLWEVCGDAEFEFAALAKDYFGHAPSPVESASILLRLQSAPIHFHRKGRGRFRKAPPQILEAALAGLEKKRQQAEQVERMAAQFARFELPPECAPLIRQIMFKPDRNRLETRAFEAACERTGLTAPALMLRCGAFQDSHDYHYQHFLFEQFPEGTEFPPFEVPDRSQSLPLAAVEAFSIDDAATTEIDDAFSLIETGQGGWQVGIHIAAPGLGFTPGDSVDAIARRRLSTVYMPGNKITMLPDEVVSRFTLAAGDARPSLSLYLDVAPDFTITGHSSKIERVPVVANLRHHDIEPVFNEHTLKTGVPAFPFKSELTVLHQLACALEAKRGKASSNQLQKEYSFAVDWSQTTPHGQGRVTISERSRGSPLDKLVAELMIQANTTWGAALHDASISGLYRAQSGGKVRMTTQAAPHEGLGVACYAWSSSPLRRYVDLINQWQLIAWLEGRAPHFAGNSPELLSALHEFEITYGAYADFQRQMERYWCLRALLDAPDGPLEGHVLRESLVRLSHLPLTLKVPSLPPTPAGSRVRMALGDVDLLGLDARVQFLETLPSAGPIEDPLDEALPSA
ncbi:MAG: hypothetical protein RIR70_904 [Pseudomonadota bacterium]|jgi:exoribonuclease-2